MPWSKAALTRSASSMSNPSGVKYQLCEISTQRRVASDLFRVLRSGGHLVSMLNPRIAVTSIGLSPRRTGRNRQVSRAGSSLAVSMEDLPSTALRVLRLHSRSIVQEKTTRVCEVLGGRVLRIGSGALSSSL